MKNADMPAMPIFDDEAKPCLVRDLDDLEMNKVPATGLTKREMFAMNFHAAILSRNGQISTKDLASKAVEHAGALLAELDK
ncbi:hypothetical protein vBVhaSMAG7_036 [Vibrio phage vB_VhaS_MAG7]|nr:hypothetical protein vBVhaSMAG7_036 [Vibrio phage vB_VhaS_MAG7]